MFIDLFRLFLLFFLDSILGFIFSIDIINFSRFSKLLFNFIYDISIYLKKSAHSITLVISYLLVHNFLIFSLTIAFVFSVSLVNLIRCFFFDYKKSFEFINFTFLFCFLFLFLLVLLRVYFPSKIFLCGLRFGADDFGSYF